jgi:hypothetical protein
VLYLIVDLGMFYSAYSRYPGQGIQILSGDDSIDTPVTGADNYLRVHFVVISRTETHYINANITRRHVKWLATKLSIRLVRLLEDVLLLYLSEHVLSWCTGQL